jgi:hypothetical protein
MKDYPSPPANLRNDSDWRDLQVIWSEVFDILPEHHLAKTGLDLVRDVFLKEVDGSRCRRRWVWSTGHGRLNDVP